MHDSFKVAQNVDTLHAAARQVTKCGGGHAGDNVASGLLESGADTMTKDVDVAECDTRHAGGSRVWIRLVQLPQGLNPEEAVKRW
jgi:hypothetical protein